jgi:hypothetical protein
MLSLQDPAPQGIVPSMKGRWGGVKDPNIAEKSVSYRQLCLGQSSRAGTGQRELQFLKRDANDGPTTS